MACPIPFDARTHITALRGWRAPAGRRPVVRGCSLVIPTANRRAEVERLLDAIAIIPDPPAEIVVVDSDRSSELGPHLLSWRSRHRVPFVLWYVECPPGLTRQRNAGVDIATGDFLCFLDPDVVPLPGYFSEMRRVFDLDRHNCVGGVAGFVINDMSPPVRGLSRLRRAIGLLPRREPLIYHPSGSHTPRTFFKPFSGLRRVDILPGCASAWRREVFAAHRFSSYFGEVSDGEHLEMSLRAGKSWTLLCSGEARVRREAAPEAPAGYESGRTRTRNRYFIWKRHVPRPATRHVVRFWLTALADAVIAFASFCLRPTRVAAVGKAAGIVAGAASCLINPPRFIEPPARREYALESDLRRRSAQGD